MNLVEAHLALSDPLPPMRALLEYVVGAGGLYARAEHDQLSALVPVALSRRPLAGLEPVAPYARLHVPRVPEIWLKSILYSARAAMPNEAMYQLVADPMARHARGGWAVARPRAHASPGHVTFLEASQEAVLVDLHSHHVLEAYFSPTDNADEQGFRFYVVIGQLDQPRPQIAARVGVFGHTLRVPAAWIFDGLGPFVDTYGGRND